MVGVRVAANLPHAAKKSEENTSANERSAISLMSAPAANAFSLPVTHDGADAGIVVEFGCGRGDLVHHLGVERVQCLRPVQRDRADAVVARDEDGLVSSLVRLIS